MKTNDRSTVPGFDDSDRRNSKRFPIQVAVRYRLLGRDSASPWVSGESLNISSTGLLFKASADITPGQGIEVYISWPVSLDRKVPLRLAVKGPVVRTSGGETAVRFERYEFKTRSLESLPN